jgi:galactofuranosylgalactofuranosylrhamnosyl-N-acetylglucosaminyl-diphospho-decaprenol beta-1,5/1,6-galactofuranosyltransferase
LLLYKFNLNPSKAKEKLYFNYSSQPERINNTILLKKGSNISFDGYFHIILIKKILEFTVLKEIILEINFKGNLSYLVQTDKKDINNFIKNDSTSPDSLKIIINLNNYLNYNFLYLVLNANEDTLIQSISINSTVNPINNIHISIVMCTFNRQSYVKNNLRKFKNLFKNELYKKKYEVYIIDNASNLIIPKYKFINYIPNKNLGGSGGFTRGMLEIYEKNKSTHICLVDDDVEIDIIAFEKLNFFLSYIKNNYINHSISGSILRLDNPFLQYEINGNWNGFLSRINNKNLDLSNKENFLKNENVLNKKNLYTAWCLFAFPISSLNNNGFPIPLFIRGDDVEFSIRNQFSPISINGFSVWHETFSTGKARSWIVYYNIRNYLIINFLYIKFSRLKFPFFILIRLFYYLIKKDKNSIGYFSKAMDDIEFIDEILINRDSEEVHKYLLLNNFHKNKLYYIFKVIVKTFIIIIYYNKIQDRLKSKINFLQSYNYWKSIF